MKGYKDDDNYTPLKASELIAVLQRLVSECGDLPVYATGPEDDVDFAPTSIFSYNKQGNSPSDDRPAHCFYIHGSLIEIDWGKP